MQLCDETLREWLNKRNAQNKSIDLPLCMEIMIQATKGLEYIHSCNIVHHDIKVLGCTLVCEESSYLEE